MTTSIPVQSLSLSVETQYFWAIMRCCLKETQPCSLLVQFFLHECKELTSSILISFHITYP